MLEWNEIWKKPDFDLDTQKPHSCIEEFYEWKILSHGLMHNLMIVKSEVVCFNVCMCVRKILKFITMWGWLRSKGSSICVLN